MGKSRIEFFYFIDYRVVFRVCVILKFRFFSEERYIVEEILKGNMDSIRE